MKDRLRQTCHSSLLVEEQPNSILLYIWSYKHFLGLYVTIQYYILQTVLDKVLQ